MSKLALVTGAYMPFGELPADQAHELVHVKVAAPTMLTRAAVPGMIARGAGTIINVSGMIAFSGPAPRAQLPLRRTVYAGALAYLVTMTQALHEEISPDGLRAQVVCPGVVATEFHERQGLDLSAPASRTPASWTRCPWPAWLPSPRKAPLSPGVTVPAERAALPVRTHPPHHLLAQHGVRLTSGRNCSARPGLWWIHRNPYCRRRDSRYR